MSPVLFVIALLSWVTLFMVGRAYGRREAGRTKRAARGLPPAQPGPGILALVPAYEGPCPSCGTAVKKHPAMRDKRCAVCVAAAFDAEDDAFVEQMKAQGWGK